MRWGSIYESHKRATHPVAHFAELSEFAQDSLHSTSIFVSQGKYLNPHLKIPLLRSIIRSGNVCIILLYVQMRKMPKQRLSEIPPG